MLQSHLFSEETKFARAPSEKKVIRELSLNSHEAQVENIPIFYGVLLEVWCLLLSLTQPEKKEDPIFESWESKEE